MRTYIIFSVFFFFTLIYAQNKVDSWDYVFNGTCPKNLSTICLPFANLSFSYIWEDHSEEQIISEANDFINSNVNFKKKIHIEKSRAWFDKSLGLFVDEKVNINETLVSFLINETYSSEFDFSLFKDKPYYERDMQLLERLNFTEPDSTNSLVRLAIMLLYHFYHFEDSPYKADLRLFPKKPVAPLVLLTNYEISLLTKDEAQNFIWDLRRFYLDTYYYLSQKLRDANFTEQDFTDLFNRTEVKTSEWTYAFSTIYAFSTLSESVINGTKKEVSFIAPIMRLSVQSKDEEKTNDEIRKLMNWQDNMLDENWAFDFKATNKLLKNDEITTDSGNEMYLIWLNMGYLLKRPDNCITINLVPKEVEETFHLPGVHCMKAHDESLLTRVYLTGNLLNMDESDMKKCKKVLEKEKNLSDERKTEILFNECKHPKWVKANLFKGIITELDMRIATYEINYKEAENVALRRIRDGANPQIPIEIRDYLSERLNTCRAIMNFVKELKKINKRMNNVSDVDRKKLKEAREEKMEQEEEAKIEKELRDEL